MHHPVSQEIRHSTALHLTTSEQSHPTHLTPQPAPQDAAAPPSIAPAIPPLEKLRDLLDRSSRTFRGLSIKHLLAAHVQVSALLAACWHLL